MRRFSSLASIPLCTFAALLLVGAAFTQDKGKDAAKTIELSGLEKGAGANFGDWAIWNYQDLGPALLLIDQKTGYVVYLPWSSNGWINLRTKEGDWMVLFAKGEPEAQDRKDLQTAKFLDKRPTLDLEEGKYTFREWDVKVTKGAIEFHNINYGDRLTMQRSSGSLVHNARPIGAKK